MTLTIQRHVKDFVDLEACPTDLEACPTERFQAIVDAVNTGAYDAGTVPLFGEVLDAVSADYTTAIKGAYAREGGLNWEPCTTNDCLQCTECVFVLTANAHAYLEQAARTYTSMLDRYLDLMKAEAISGEATEESRHRIADYSMLAYECANRIKELSM